MKAQQLDRRTLVKRLNRFLRPLFPQMALSIGARVLKLLLATALIAVAAGTIGHFYANPDNSVLFRAVILLFIIAGFLGLSHYLEQYTGHYIAFRLLALLRNDFYDKMEPLAPAGFAKLRSGDAIARAINDVERIEPYYAHTVAPAFAAIIVPGILLAVLASYNIMVALALAPFLTIMVFVVPIITDKIGQDASHEARIQLGEVNAHLTDSLQGLREVVIFNYGERRRQEIWERGQKMQKAQDRLIGADATQRGITEVMIVGAVIAVLWACMHLVQQGELDLLLDVPVILAITMTSFTAVIGLTNVINDFNTAMISADRVYELMDQLPTVTETAVSAPADFVPSIHFGKVCFSYESATDVLREMSFDIEAGQTVAVVGESGAGKSTLVNLLMRFWDAQSGTIRLGNHDLQDFPFEDLRAKIGVVSQRTYIFNTTIAENIRMGNPNATDAEVAEAARRANLEDYIEGLPDKYETQCGEMGSKLSGGQRQRVAIARALLKDAPILILDEATSDLDVETEREVKAAIDALMTGRTTMVIAHRLSAVVDADKILVLQNGRVCESGTHEALLQANGVYTRLFELQQDEIDTIVIEEEE